MQKNTKEWMQYGSALGMLISGAVMSFLSFFLAGYEVKDSVLWYLAQCMVYAGSIFGVAVYVNTKVGEVKNYIERHARRESFADDELVTERKETDNGKKD